MMHLLSSTKNGEIRREMKSDTLTTLQKFNRLWDNVNAAYHKASGRMGFSDSERTILYMLCDYQRPMSQNEIIRLTGLSKQTVNSSVSRMKKAGWLAMGERSNRQLLMSLTDQGREVVQEKLVPFMADETQIFEHWTAEDQNTLIELMERYEKSLAEIVDNMD